MSIFTYGGIPQSAGVPRWMQKPGRGAVQSEDEACRRQRKLFLPSSGFLASLGFLKRLLEVSEVYDHVVGPRGLTLCVSGCRVGGKGHQGEGLELDIITRCTLSWVGD